MTINKSKTSGNIEFPDTRKRANDRADERISLNFSLCCIRYLVGDIIYRLMRRRREGMEEAGRGEILRINKGKTLEEFLELSRLGSHIEFQLSY